jgi:hypothetical protein
MLEVELDGHEACLGVDLMARVDAVERARADAAATAFAKLREDERPGLVLHAVTAARLSESPQACSLAFVR